MHSLNHVFAVTLLVAPAIAQFGPLPAPTLISRTAPRAAWTSVTSAGLTATGTTFRADNPGAASSSTIYVFGGCVNNNTTTTTNDLWAFDAIAGTFTQLHDGTVSPAPHARGRAAVAWNPTTNKLVVFGGDNRATGPQPANTLFNDTWEYDPSTNTWADVTPAVGNPSPRRWATMTYDPTLGGMLMFGGEIAGGAVSSETWLFLGGTWLPMGAGGPPARRMASLVTRTSPYNDVLLCAGEDASTLAPEVVRHLDVWTWNGNWTKISDYDWVLGTGTFPASAMANQAVYDAARQRVVLQGGQGIAANTASNTLYNYGLTTYNGSPTNYTSEFDCVTNTWSIYANATTGTAPYNNNDPQIGRISRYYAAYVPATGKVYKVCGQNAAGSSSMPTYNVYAYQANPVASAPSYGAGCVGSAGPLTLTANNLPWTSRTFSATGTGFPVGALGAGVIGFTQTSVPLSALHPLGVAGCSLLANTDATMLLLPVAGSVTMQITIPGDPSFSGLALNLQAVCLEFSPSLNLTAITSTNGVAVTVGAL